MVVSYTDPPPGEVQRTDRSKAERLLDRWPEVDLAEGLKRTLDWDLEQTRSKNAQSRGPPLGVRTLRVYGPDEAVLTELRPLSDP